MKLPLRIALRYLFARKSQNIINVISIISVIGVMVGTLALLLVLSVFNGLHLLIGQLYGSFDPDLKIEPVMGKVFSLDTIPYQQLISTPGVLNTTHVITDQALVRNGKRQMPCIIMGVDSTFGKVCPIDSIIMEGSYKLSSGRTDFAILGAILAEQLSVGLNFVSPLGIYVPRRNSSFNVANPESGFKTDYVMPGGIFQVKQVDYDSQFILLGLDKTRELLEYDSTTVSYIGIDCKTNHSVEKLKLSLKEIVGPHFTVKNKEEQHATFFKMMKIEKLMAFLILSFIMVIATFNVIGTLSMLIYEKKESIFTLKSMGASRKLVTQIFLIEGWLISLSGVFAGIFLGATLILIQQYFGIIKFQGLAAFVVEAYPVALKLTDILAVFLTVTTVGFLAAWYPVRIIVRKYYNASKDDE